MSEDPIACSPAADTVDHEVFGSSPSSAGLCGLGVPGGLSVSSKQLRSADIGFDRIIY